jgi:2-iminobutanoate/2-iminopropanoate deaminase
MVKRRVKMRQKIDLDNILKSVGPYSVAIKVDKFIFLSGIIGIKPDKKELVSDDIVEQANQIFEHLKNILSHLKLSPENVIKSTVYTTNLDAFAKINQIYERFFTPPYPARAVVGVSSLPLNSKIEIEFVIYSNTP